jgi:predicted pyridoxine 5'-phosphate oxidase superfamily flavin-nucleotide-binding protein
MPRPRTLRSKVDRRLREFIAERNSFYFGTAGADGQPYIQHRGGPKGFLRVLDDHTLAFDDLEGNRQYISVDNLAENPRAFLFLMDYAEQRRIKIWGRARVEGAKGSPRRIVFEVEAWDINCPQHIPQKVDAGDVEQVLVQMRARITQLEEENAALRGPRP